MASLDQPAPHTPEAPDYFSGMESLVRIGLGSVLFTADSATGVTELHSVETLGLFYAAVTECARRGRVPLGMVSLTGEGPRSLLCHPLGPEAVQFLTDQYIAYIAGLLRAVDKGVVHHERLQ